MALIELVDFNEAALASTAKKAAKKTTRRSSKKAEAAPAAEVETPAAE
jgi:large subunit ribosomal protein L17